jgi:hypothetical protein
VLQGEVSIGKPVIPKPEAHKAGKTGSNGSTMGRVGHPKPSGKTGAGALPPPHQYTMGIVAWPPPHAPAPEKSTSKP